MKSSFIFLCLFLLSVFGFAQGFVEEPQNCVASKHYPCAVRSLKMGQKLEFSGSVANLDQGTTFLIYSPEEWRILEGSLWLRSEKKMQMSAGVAQFAVNGDVWINKATNEKIVVRNLNGEVKVSSPLLSFTQMIPVGFENWYSIINSDMSLAQGILRPIDAQVFLPEWLKLAKLPKTSVLQLIATYKKSWKGNIEASAELYQQVVSRHMASQENAEEAKVERQKRMQIEHEKLRQMYRERFEEDKAFRLIN